MGVVNSWDLTVLRVLVFSCRFLLYPLEVKSLGVAAHAVALPHAVSPCVWIHRHIRCWVLLCCWLFYA